MSARTPLPMAIRTLWFLSSSFWKQRERRSANSHPLITRPLRSFYLRRVAEVAHCFTNVLHHCHVMLPAVVPELRGRELSPQNKGYTCGNIITQPLFRCKRLKCPTRCVNVRIKRLITSLDGSGHADEEARAVVQRQVDVQDVLWWDPTACLDEGGGPHPLMADNCCFGQTFQRKVKLLRLLNTRGAVGVSKQCFCTSALLCLALNEPIFWKRNTHILVP